MAHRLCLNGLPGAPGELAAFAPPGHGLCPRGRF